MNKNPFKEISPNKEVPAELKATVMKDAAYVELFKELGDLFFVKFPSILEESLKSKT